MSRRGRDNAVSIEAIGRQLWNEDWTMGGDEGERRRKKICRAVKRTVARLVNRQGLPIVSFRGKVHGYFVPAEKKEIDKAVRTSVNQAVNMLKRARKLTGDPYYDELAGQLSLRF